MVYYSFSNYQHINFVPFDFHCLAAEKVDIWRFGSINLFYLAERSSFSRTEVWGFRFLRFEIIFLYTFSAINQGLFVRLIFIVVSTVLSWLIIAGCCLSWISLYLKPAWKLWRNGHVSLWVLNWLCYSYYVILWDF